MIDTNLKINSAMQSSPKHIELQESKNMIGSLDLAS